MWRSEVELCVIKMAATYTFFVPASLWSTTEDSVTLATPHKRHTPHFPSAPRAQRPIRAWADPLLGRFQPSPGAQASSQTHAHMRVPMETGRGFMLCKGPHTHRRKQLVCGKVGKGISENKKL